MAKEHYQDIPFSGARLRMVEICDQIITEYVQRGYRLTLRQLYYRIVARDLFPADRKWVVLNKKWVRHPEGTINAEPNYDWLGTIVSDGRLAGYLDWDAIEDRTRELNINSRWNKPSDIIHSAAGWYQNDLWRWQPVRPEVWVEKDALVAVLQRACQSLDVPFFSCRGYTSQTSMREAGERLRRIRERSVVYEGKHQRKGGQKFRQQVLIFHLGDHDPSGVDMTRDIGERLTKFARQDVEVRRIALNMDQIQQYKPPPNPAKTTDSRFRTYAEQYGDESWELDALDPDDLVTLIQDNLYRVMDRKRFQEAVDIMEHGRKELEKLRDNYEKAITATS